MCGIAGFIRLNGCATPNPVVRRVARRLLYQISERGDKATGYAYVGERGLKVVKDKVGVKEFIKRYENTLNQDVGRARAWIAHSRAPTRGGIEQAFNNHPLFTKGGLAMVHNGIVYNTDEVFEHFKLGRDGEVDSEVILKLIEHQRTATTHNGEAIKGAVRYLDGSLTFALIDEADPSEVWLHRWGSYAPVSVAVSKGLIVFASELEHVLQAVGRKSRGFFRLPACSVRTLQNGELVRLSGKGIEFDKTDPESEAIERKIEGWGFGSFSPSPTTTQKGDPDDDEAWRLDDAVCPECGAYGYLNRNEDLLTCFACGSQFKIGEGGVIEPA